MAKTITTGFISDTINGIKVNSSKPCSSTNYNSYTSRSVAYIIMHYTGNVKDTAYANANYFQGKNRGASAHFFVDDNNIYQSIALRHLAWHCGASKYYHDKARNANSWGIEMCCTAGNYKISQKTIKNAAHLCANLCKRLGITAANVDTYVLRHYDVTHKECPRQMSDGGKGDADWIAFKDMVKSILGGVQTPSTPKPTTTTTKAPAKEMYRVRKTWADSASQKGAFSNLNNAKECCDKAGSGYEVYDSNGKAIYPPTGFKAYTVMINTPVLRIRKGPGTNYAHVGNVKKGEIYTIVDKSGSWGKLKSGAGWISLNYTKKQ